LTTALLGKIASTKLSIEEQRGYTQLAKMCMNSEIKLAQKLSKKLTELKSPSALYIYL
jgi:hypothetical protein